jgi:hypothetical protein
MIVNVASGKNPVAPVQDLGRDLEKGTTAVGALADAPNALIIDLSHQAFGDAGKIAAEVTLAGVRYPEAVATYSAAQVAEIAQGNVSIAELLSANPTLRGSVVALAAAIELAASEFRNSAKLVPASIRSVLTDHYREEVIDRARFTVGTVGINLPEAVVGTRKALGDAYAVTVDDVIVFSEEPADTVEGRHWWAHEMRHVAQYSEWGVSLFAYRYLTDWKAVEADAESLANVVVPLNS